jgi:hypothetical protein
VTGALTGNPTIRAAVTWALVVVPAVVGVGVAIAWAAGASVPPVDPVSVAGAGLIGSAAAATTTMRAAGNRAVQAAWAVVAVLGAWVVANRLVGVSTGPVRPGYLLVLAAAVIAFALAGAVWGDAWRRHMGAGWRAVARDPDRWNLRLVATVAAATRLVVMFRVPVFVIGDSGGYVEAAGTIAQAGSFAPLLGFYPPAYSVFLAGVWAVLGPDFLAAAAVQHVFGVVTALATYGVARAALPPAWALLPALATATNGYVLILEHGIYTEALFVPLLTVTAWLATRLLGSGTRDRWRLAATTGAMMALASLTRLVLQPFLAVLVAGILVADGWPPRREAWVRVGALVGAFVVAVAPWVAHNWIVYGYVGLSNGTGVSALLPRLWEEEATYVWANAEHPDPLIRSVTLTLQAERDRGASYWQAYLRVRRDFPDMDASGLVATASVDVILRHPTLFIDRTWFRLQRLWAGGFARETVNDLYGEQTKLGIRSPIFEVRPDGGVDAEVAGNQAHALTKLVRPDDVPAGVAFVLTILAVVGAGAAPRPLAALVPVGLGTGLVFLAVLLNSDRARYRHPAEPFLVIAYVVGVHATWRALRWAWRRLRRPASVPVDGSNVPA